MGMRATRRQFLVGAAGAATRDPLRADVERPGRGPRGAPARHRWTAAVAGPGRPGWSTRRGAASRVDEYLLLATAPLNPTDPESISAHLIRARPRSQLHLGPVVGDTRRRAARPVPRHRRLLADVVPLAALPGSGHPARRRDRRPRVVPSPRPGTATTTRCRPAASTTSGSGRRTTGSSSTSTSTSPAGLPDRRFTITGLTGAEHAARTRQPIARLDRRAGPVRASPSGTATSTCQETSRRSPMLAEFADDPEVVRVGRRGARPVPVRPGRPQLTPALRRHPRPVVQEGQDRASRDQDIFGPQVALRRRPTSRTRSRPTSGATVPLRGASVPAARGDPSRSATSDEVAHRSANATASRSTRTSRSSTDPVAPYGDDFDDPANLPFWWAQGALTAWQLVPQTLADGRPVRPVGHRAVRRIKALGRPQPASTRPRPRSGVLELRRRDQRRRARRGGHHDVAEPRRDAVDGASTTASASYASRSTPGRRPLDERRARVHHATRSRAAPSHRLGRRRPATGPARRRCPAVGPARARRDPHLPTAWYARRPTRCSGRCSATSPTPTPTSPRTASTRCASSATGRSAAEGDGYVALWSWRAPTWRAYDPAIDATDGHDQAVRPGRPGWRRQRVDRRGRPRRGPRLVRVVRARWRPSRRGDPQPGPRSGASRRRRPGR